MMTPSGLITNVPRQGQALFFDHDVEVAGDGAGGVTNQGVLDLVDGLGGLVPGFVGEVGVGRHAVDLNAQGLEGVVMVGQVTEFGGANKGEVGGVKEHHGPLTLQGGFGDLDKICRFGTRWP